MGREGGEREREIERERERVHARGGESVCVLHSPHTQSKPKQESRKVSSSEVVVGQKSLFPETSFIKPNNFVVSLLELLPLTS